MKLNKEETKRVIDVIRIIEEDRELESIGKRRTIKSHRLIKRDVEIESLEFQKAKLLELIELYEELRTEEIEEIETLSEQVSTLRTEIDAKNKILSLNAEKARQQEGIITGVANILNDMPTGGKRPYKREYDDAIMKIWNILTTPTY